MSVTGWGQYPIIKANTLQAHSKRKVSEILQTFNNTQNISPQSTHLIARGLGRSYGDSALSPNILQTNHLNHFIEFNSETGNITCSAGISFAEILELFVPRGWFLPVTPGTKFITVGGAVASDVHGKNHHIDGSFSQHVSSLKIALASGEIVTCSLNDKPELFLATCGGMGLTGVIVQVSFKLIPIKSAYISEQTYKTANLAETLEQFEAHEASTYSVAWIDCLATGEQLGRSLLMLGEHSSEGELKAHQTSKISVPVNMPSLLLNPFSVQAFNTLYYSKQTKSHSTRNVHYEPFFYPLDSINNWNRLYGKNGFTQYQFVLPKSAGLQGVTEVLKAIAKSKRGSFLAVLKAFGKGNDNYLSFPMEGYTLALDFKIDAKLFAFLDELDRIVLDFGGRLYLTKDVRMSETTFKQSYANWQTFQSVRQQYGADQRFHSLQSLRLGL